MTFLSRHIVLIICLLCILVPALFWLIGQVELIYRIVVIYFLAGTFLWGLLFIFDGVRRRREERQQRLPNLQRWGKLYFYLGLLIILGLPTLLIGNNRIWDLWGNNPFGLTGEFFLDLIKLATTYVILVGLLFLEIVCTPLLVRTLLQMIHRLHTGAEEGQRAYINIGLPEAYYVSEENLSLELQQVREQIPDKSELDRSKRRIFVQSCLLVVSIVVLMYCLIFLNLSGGWIWPLVLGWVVLTFIIVKPLQEDMVKFLVTFALRKREKVLSQAMQEMMASTAVETNSEQ